jgi:CRP/FNR family nitrogen fixation transcriptional regulator
MGLAERNAALDLRLRMIMQAKLRYTGARMMLLGRKTAMEKIASLLLEMRTRCTAPDQRLLELPMRRADIADYLGMTIETVCRGLGHLQREGVVATQGMAIELRNLQVLRDLA